MAIIEIQLRTDTKMRQRTSRLKTAPFIMMNSCSRSWTTSDHRRTHVQLVTRTIFMKPKRKLLGCMTEHALPENKRNDDSWRPARTRALIELPEIYEAARPSLFLQSGSSTRGISTIPSELLTKTHMAKQGTSGKSSNRDELREGDEAAQHRKSHQCTLGATEQSRDQRHPRAHWRIKASGTCQRQFCASFLFSLICASCRWWWCCVFLRSISVWKVLFSLKCCLLGAHVAPSTPNAKHCFPRLFFPYPLFPSV